MMMRKRVDAGTLIDDVESVESYRKVSMNKKSIHEVSTLIGLLVFGSLLGLFAIVFYVDAILPKPLTIIDEKLHSDAFITERAANDLKLLTANGPRIAGSYENEVLAVEFLTREIKFIQQQSHSNQNIELNHQIVTGSYYLAYSPFGAINSYLNLQNIVVKINGRNNATSSLLINAHFDSVPSSPGGSDDGIMCAVMLEILRKLSRESERPTHNIIFLFNGAEETPLQASHGFISQHKWAKECKVLINLDAAGSGGKEILFQTGPNIPWLLKYYGKVPHPLGQAAGEEIFQSNLIPSDTDFRIFRDFGGLVGYDFAFARNGYRYHTKYDGFANIPLGSYQHAGNNILKLVKEVSNAPELENPSEGGNAKIVYYDFLGYFIISYSATIGMIINVFVVAISSIVAYMYLTDYGQGFALQSMKYMVLTLSTILFSWIVAALFVYFLSTILDQYNVRMSWYNNPWLIFGLYSAPTLAILLAGLIFLNTFLNVNKLSISIQSQIQAHLIRIIWTVVLLIGTLLGIRSAYAIMVPILFNTICFICIKLFRLQYTNRVWQAIYYLSTIWPAAWLLYQTLLTMTLFIPITGRMGPDKNPELFIGLFALFFTIATVSYHVPLITLVRKPMYVVYALILLFVTTLLILYTPLGFPYSGNPNSPAPQRFMIYHTNRIFHNDAGNVIKKDSGYFLLNLDRNSPQSIKKYVDLTQAKSVEDDCNKYLCCGLPISSPRMLGIMKDSTWIPSEEAVITEPISLRLIAKDTIASGVIRYNFSAEGPDHLSFYISPTHETNITAISLTNDLPENQVKWNNNKIYFINHVYGKEKASINFYVDLKTTGSVDKKNLHIAISGKYVNDKVNKKTTQFRALLSTFPIWADVIPALANFESYIF